MKNCLESSEIKYCFPFFSSYPQSFSMLSKKENFTHTKNKGEKGIVENGKEWLQHQNKEFSEGVKSIER